MSLFCVPLRLSHFLGAAHIHTKLYSLPDLSVLLPAVHCRSNNVSGSDDKHTVKCKPTLLTRVTCLFHILCDAQACSNSTDTSNKPVQNCFSPLFLHPAHHWSLGHHVRALHALCQVHPLHSTVFPTSKSTLLYTVKLWKHCTYTIVIKHFLVTETVNKWMNLWTCR